MREATISDPTNDSLVNQFEPLFKALRGTQQNEQLHFDLTNLHWAYPLLILPLAAYIESTGSTCGESGSQEVDSYLNTISFPGGIDSISSFEEQIQEHRTYIPISVLRRQNGQNAERLQALFSKIVYQALDAVPGSQSAIYYPIGELVTNIFEHSKQNTGFIFAQKYPKKNFVDICIVDRGRGLACAYKEEVGLELSDQEAITEAMRGRSTKPGPERGYGVHTSKKLICKGLGGNFVLITGEGIVVSNRKADKIATLPSFNWQGVVIAYRIPKVTHPIDLSSFLE